MMRKLLMSAVSALLLVSGLEAQAGDSSLGAGARYRAKHSTFADEIPFGNGDISYFAAYQYSEGIAAWELAFDYAPDISGKKPSAAEGGDPLDVDYILTPGISLLFTDKYFRGGGGTFMSYVRDDDGGSWEGPGGQLQVGLHFPFGSKLALDLATYYIFTRFSDFEEFDFGELEYSGSLTYTF